LGFGRGVKGGQASESVINRLPGYAGYAFMLRNVERFAYNEFAAL